MINVESELATIQVQANNLANAARDMLATRTPVAERHHANLVKMAENVTHADKLLLSYSLAPPEETCG